LIDCFDDDHDDIYLLNQEANHHQHQDQ